MHLMLSSKLLNLIRGTMRLYIPAWPCSIFVSLMWKTFDLEAANILKCNVFKYCFNCREMLQVPTLSPVSLPGPKDSHTERN